MAAPVATRLRDALRDYLCAAAESLTDPPERRYLSVGPPRVTCALLAVYAQLRTVSLDQPGELPAPRPQPRVRLATLIAELWRPTCTDLNATADTLDAEGVEHATDGWELLTGLTYRLQSNDVFTTLTLPATTKSANVDVVELLEPAGGWAGWRAATVVHL